MKKKLSLLEIAGIIVIASLLLFVLVIPMIKMFNENRKKANSTYDEIVLLAIGSFSKEYPNILPIKQGETITLNIGILKQLKYLREDFSNKENNECISNDTPISITKIGTTYKYKIDWREGSDACDENPNGPIIILKGNMVEYSEFGEEYSEKGYITLDNEGNIIDSINVEVSINNASFIDIYSFNNYLLTYSLILDNVKFSINRRVIISDNTAPEINLPENETILASLQMINLLDGVLMKDNSIIQPKISVEGDLSLGNAGMYKIIYTATDGSGNFTTKVRLISVIDDLPPSVDSITTNMETNSDGFYTTDISFAISLSDTGGSGIGGFVYCTTASNSCTPNLKIESNKGTFVLRKNSGHNKFCLYAFDYASNDTKTECYGPYNFIKKND